MSAGREVLRGRWLAGLGLFACLPLGAQRLEARLANELLRVSAPQLRFLTGKPLERLRNGAPVAFVFHLTLSTDVHATVFSRDIERFVLSYDLWEEKFSIVKLGHPRRSVSHLSSEATEAWCVDELRLPTPGLAREKPFWVRLEARAEAPREQAALENETAVSLARLIEAFSRRARGEQARWVVEAGPLRLVDLKQDTSRAPVTR